MSVLQDRLWLARVLRADGAVVGGAFVVHSGHLVTCAHVVQDAGAEGPGDIVAVDFPSLGEADEAEVLTEGWRPEDGSAGDVALLRLARTHAGTRPVPLRSARSVTGRRFVAYGFPDGYEDGVTTQGTAGMEVGREWLQLEAQSAIGVLPGFSGAAVWDSDREAVVGVMVTRDTPTEGRAAFAVPTRVLAANSPVLRDALLTPLELDPARVTHWGPRSRGVNSDRDDAGWLFTGRQGVLCELVAWLTSEEPPAMRVLTGAPGCGKSAVMARLVTTSDRRHRSRVPDLVAGDAAVPPVDVFDVTYLATGRTVADLVAHIGEVCDIRATEPAELLAALDGEQRRLVLAVDAVDEAGQPRELCWLLNDLVDHGCRALVACRPHLTGQLGDPEPMRLDEPARLDPNAVEAYVAALLTRPRGGDATGAAIPDSRAAALAREVSDAASGNFLIAQLVAHALALGGTTVRPLPRDLARAFERLLTALPDPDAAQDLLLPLALGFGDGLPADLWLTATAALRRRYQPADLDDLLDGPAAAFLVSARDAPGDTRHRLFHQALAETLTAHRDTRALHRSLLEAWTATLPASEDGRPRWSDASPYLLQHAADHAAAADRLAELADDPEYLLAGSLTRLSAQLAATPRAGKTKATLELAGWQAEALDREHRATTLALAARHLGLSDLADDLTRTGDPHWRSDWAHWPGTPHRRLTGHSGAVHAVAIGRAGDRDLIVSAGQDGTTRRWDAVTGTPVGDSLTGTSIGDALDGFIEHVNVVAIGRAGGHDLITSASTDGAVRRWDAVTGAPIGDSLTGTPIRRRFSGPAGDRVTALDIGRADDRDIIVAAGQDGTVRRWDALTGAPAGDPITGHSGWVGAIAIGRAGDRDLIVSAGQDGTVRRWDAVTGTPVGDPITGHDGWVHGAAMGRVGNRDLIVSAGEDGTVRRWDAVTGAPVGEPLTGHGSPVKLVAVGRVGDRDLIASADADGTIRRWDADSGASVGEPLTGQSSVNALAIGRAGKGDLIASAGSGGTVRLWDPAAGAALGNPLTGHSGVVAAIAVGRVGDRDLIASGDTDGTVSRWDPVTGAPVGDALIGHTESVFGVAVGRAGDRDLIASGDTAGTVRRWDAVTGAPIGDPLTGHSGWVRAVAIGRAGDRDLVASAGEDETVRRWDAVTGARVGEPLTGHRGLVRAVAIGRAGDRDLVASAGDDWTVRLWDAVTGAPIGNPLGGHGGWVTAVAIGQAGDRDLIVSGGVDGRVRLWDPVSRQSVGVIHTIEQVSAIALGSSGRVYVAGGRAVCCFVARTADLPGATQSLPLTPFATPR